jgi:P27 family predicted phage terminase small subunit
MATTPRKSGPGLKVGSLRLVTPTTTGQVGRPNAAAAVDPLAPLKPQGVKDNPEMSALWDEVVPQLDKAGLLSTADVMTVETALRHFLVMRKASDQVLEQGVMIDGVAEQKKHPAEAVFRLESTHFLEYAKQLGMTFVARARTEAPKVDDGDGNPFASKTG